MSDALIEKINKAREQVVEAGGLSFVTRRPTDLEVLEMRGQGVSQRDLLRRFVLGWQGVKEIDLIPGGTPKPVEFDHDLFLAWVEDQPEVYAKLLEHITGAYKTHEQQRAEALKKPDAG